MNVARIGIALFVVLALTPFVAADHYRASVGTDDATINPENDETGVFTITVTNHGTDESRFSIDYRVSNPSWYFLTPYVLTLEPNETGNATLYVTPDRTAVSGNKGFTVLVRDDDETVERNTFFTIVRDREAILQSIDTDRLEYDPSDTVTVTATVRNVRRTEFDDNEFRAVFTVGEMTETVGLEDLDPGEVGMTQAEFTLGQYAAGSRDVQVMIERSDGKQQGVKNAVIDIRAGEQLERDSERRNNILYAAETLSVENIGNAPADDVHLQASIPWYYRIITQTDQAPTTVSRADGQVTYEWAVGTVAPGTGAAVRYQVNYWMPVTAVILLGLVSGSGIYLYRRPRIEKHVNIRNGTHSLHLRVTNRSSSTMEAVSVQDHIPNVASLIEKFDASPPEKIRHGSEETELEWQLGDIAPGEERILTYQISPNVAVEESLTLPKAQITYHTDGREKSRTSGIAFAPFR